MPEEIEGQTPETTEAQEASEETRTEQTSEKTSERDQFDADYVKSLRKESASYRKKMQELEAKLKEREDAELSELERLKKRAEEAEQAREAVLSRANRTAIRSAATIEAGKLDVKPDRITALIRLAGDDLFAIEVDDDGEPDAKAVKKILSAALEEYPEWKRSATASRSGGEFNGSGGVSNDHATMNTLIRRAAGRDV